MDLQDYLGQHRVPRTTQERRANQKRDKWHRGKRGWKALPHAWTDLNACRQHWRKNRSWKLLRKTRWKRIAGEKESTNDDERRRSDQAKFRRRKEIPPSWRD